MAVLLPKSAINCTKAILETNKLNWPLPTAPKFLDISTTIIKPSAETLTLDAKVKTILFLKVKI